MEIMEKLRKFIKDDKNDNNRYTKISGYNPIMTYKSMNIKATALMKHKAYMLI